MSDIVVEPEVEVAVVDPEIKTLFSNLLLNLPLREAREEFERIYLTEMLKQCDGKVSKLAGRVDMERTHLYRKLRQLGVPFA